MTPAPGPAAVSLRAFARAIALRDWSALRKVLADDLGVRLLHTGEVLDADGFVSLNQTYPGDWTYVADEIVDGGDRAVLRSHTLIGEDAWHAASFATTGPDGRIAELVEIWTDAVPPHPERTT